MKATVATQKTVVVAERFWRTTGVLITCVAPAGRDAVNNAIWLNPPGCVALVVLMPNSIDDWTVVPAGVKNPVHVTSQSPADSDMLVAFAAMPEVKETVLVVFVGFSPALPDCTLSPSVVPTMPAVVDGVIVLVACRVVNFPAAAVVAPTVALLITPPVIVGVDIAGPVLNTTTPVPVSSEITPANCADVVAANCASVPVVVAELA